MTHDAMATAESMYSNKGWFHGLGSRTTFNQAVADAKERAAEALKKKERVEAKKVLDEQSELEADKKREAEDNAIIDAADIKDKEATKAKADEGKSKEETGEEAFAQRGS